MSTAVEINWPGASGKNYKYRIYSLETNFKEEAGNYIFAKRNAQNLWVPVYIGQTKDLNRRLENHEKEACAKKHGATHIHVHLTSGGETARVAEETDLLKKWNTNCNVQNNS